MICHYQKKANKKFNYQREVSHMNFSAENLLLPRLMHFQS
jgi:hypothetical protein